MGGNEPPYAHIGYAIYCSGIVALYTPQNGQRVATRCEKEADCHAEKNGTRNDGTHKEEILATRRGGFGSSDASMILEIAKTGKIYKQEHFKRLAVFEGILEPENFTTPAMEVGNQREKEIFEWYSFAKKCRQKF